MSRGVENNTCVISLNRFETTSRVQSGFNGHADAANWFEPIPLLQCGQTLRAHLAAVFANLEGMDLLKGGAGGVEGWPGRSQGLSQAGMGQAGRGQGGSGSGCARRCEARKHPRSGLPSCSLASHWTSSWESPTVVAGPAVALRKAGGLGGGTGGHDAVSGICGSSDAVSGFSGQRRGRDPQQQRHRRGLQWQWCGQGLLREHGPFIYR